MEVNSQYSRKVTGWIGIISDQIIGPYFFNATLNGRRYLEFLHYFVVATLTRCFPGYQNPNQIFMNIWYPQDGTPPHVVSMDDLRGCQSKLLNMRQVKVKKSQKKMQTKVKFRLLSFFDLMKLIKST